MLRPGAFTQSILDRCRSPEVQQLFRFVVVGVANTAFGYAIIFACMYLVGLSAELSNAVGYGIGLLVSYVMHKAFTFNSDRPHREAFVRFLVVFAAAYAANLLVLVILVRGIGVHEAISQVIASAVYVITSFIMNKLYVFRQSHDDAK
ncbi:GtrA family protein [Variovorax sp. NFACC27]|uniref:GtrA family protein n=1 Tax=unclassified Variovorax TaxID=663243 RepID=UPI00089D03D9|nr:Putative flippase GtrA (transmembrane translocase of bactoprenol-linked glucose) [Variovorax sp. NFACC28]